MTKTKILRKIDFITSNYLVEISIEFCLKDLWIGLYWENEYIINKIVLNEKYNEYMRKLLDLYFIVIPCLPIHISLRERLTW